MGYGTRNNGQIRTYWPDDTDTEMYIDASIGMSLEDIRAKIDEKWPDASASNLMFTSQKIHTDCLGYDLYDPIDYTDFIIITRNPGA